MNLDELRKGLKDLAEEERLLAEEKKAKERDKNHVSTSQRLMFIVIGLALGIFIVSLFMAYSLRDTYLMGETLKQMVYFSTPVLVAIVAKSGFENISKGKTRDRIIQGRIRDGQKVNLGDEDFRNLV